jgi:hypothetical protein
MSLSKALREQADVAVIGPINAPAGLCRQAADRIDELEGALREILRTSRDLWEFDDKGDVVGKVYVIAKRAIRD